MKFQYRDKNKNNKKAKTDVFNCWNDILRYKFNLPKERFTGTSNTLLFNIKALTLCSVCSS